MDFVNKNEIYYSCRPDQAEAEEQKDKYSHFFRILDENLNLYWGKFPCLDEFCAEFDQTNRNSTRQGK